MRYALVLPYGSPHSAASASEPPSNKASGDPFIPTSDVRENAALVKTNAVPGGIRRQLRVPGYHHRPPLLKGGS
jgi:hypothetical protein